MTTWTFPPVTLSDQRRYDDTDFGLIRGSPIVTNPRAGARRARREARFVVQTFRARPPRLRIVRGISLTRFLTLFRVHGDMDARRENIATWAALAGAERARARTRHAKAVSRYALIVKEAVSRVRKDMEVGEGTGSILSGVFQPEVRLKAAGLTAALRIRGRRPHFPPSTLQVKRVVDLARPLMQNLLGRVNTFKRRAFL